MSLYIGNYKISLKKPCNIGRQLYSGGPVLIAKPISAIYLCVFLPVSTTSISVWNDKLRKNIWFAHLLLYLYLSIPRLLINWNDKPLKNMSWRNYSRDGIKTFGKIFERVDLENGGMPKTRLYRLIKLSKTIYLSRNIVGSGSLKYFETTWNRNLSFKINFGEDLKVYS